MVPPIGRHEKSQCHSPPHSGSSLLVKEMTACEAENGTDKRFGAAQPGDYAEGVSKNFVGSESGRSGSGRSMTAVGASSIDSMIVVGTSTASAP